MLRYDNARRLISEVRLNNDDPAHSYDLAYEYDQGGNRTKKIDTQSSSYRVEVVYHYDIENPAISPKPTQTRVVAHPRRRGRARGISVPTSGYGTVGCKTGHLDDRGEMNGRIRGMGAVTKDALADICTYANTGYCRTSESAL